MQSFTPKSMGIVNTGVDINTDNLMLSGQGNKITVFNCLDQYLVKVIFHSITLNLLYFNYFQCYVSALHESQFRVTPIVSYTGCFIMFSVLL